mmetsp:Transcript_91017/g.283579  ORF Transcript_91017/g.283579 Transcript_91017/m.283579 type:complete len:296 (+) Transcript_91017:364-1251(+)
MGHVEHVGEREHRVEELGQLWPRARHPQEGVAVHAYQGHAEQERWPVRQVGIFDEAVDEHDAGVGHEDGYRDQAEEAYVCQEPHVDAAQPVGEIQPLHELMQDRPHVGQPYLTRYPQVDQARVALEVVVRVALGVVVQVAQHQEGEGRGPQTGHVQQDQERKEARRVCPAEQRLEERGRVVEEHQHRHEPQRAVLGRLHQARVPGPQGQDLEDVLEHLRRTGLLEDDGDHGDDDRDVVGQEQAIHLLHHVVLPRQAGPGRGDPTGYQEQSHHGFDPAMHCWVCPKEVDRLRRRRY